MLNREPLIVFLIIAFSLAWTLFLLPLAFGPVGTLPRQIATTVSWSLAMWAPGLGAIIATRWVAGEKLGTLNLRRLGDWRAYLWALLLFPALTVVTGLLTWILGAGELDTQFTAIQRSLAAVPGGAALPAGLFVLIQIGAGLTIGPLINTIFALGEELGWRGFLLPRLLPLGQWRAIVLSGAIWGLWHAPAILQGHNYPTQPVVGVFMMIVFSVLLGAVFSWLYLRTRSPWAPALAHGSVNAIAGLPLLFLTGVDITIGGTLASVIGWIPLGLFVAWLVWSKRLPVEIPGSEAQPQAIPQV
jgi:membrane protease YdiL (CAAX protease family)